MKIKTTELKGVALDWAVAKCEGSEKGDAFLRCRKAYPSMTAGPSNNWSQGGPIIEREGISLRQSSFAGKILWDAAKSVAPQPSEEVFTDATWAGAADNPLTAAMRCFVECKLGKEIDIPDELAKIQIDIIPTTWAVSNKSYMGEVIGLKDPEHIIQFIGKNTYISHEIKNLDRQPSPGEKVTITYDEKRQGKVIPREKAHALGQEK